MRSIVKIRKPSGRFEKCDHAFFSQDASGATSGETAWELPRELGKGRFRRIGFPSGIRMTISHCRFDHPYLAKIEFDRPVVTLVFTLAGHTETRTSLLKEGLNFQQGESCLHYLPDTVITREIDPRHFFQAVVIKIAPEHLEKMVGDQGALFPKAVASILGGNGESPWECTQKFSPAIRNTLCQILNPPLPAPMGNLYLESKAMELIAHKLGQIAGPASTLKKFGGFDPGEIGRIHQAGRSLIRQMQNPPSLQELAREAGMSHTKLNRGFRLVFGCTVFAYLRWQRLEHARQLLIRKGFNVTQAAHEAGFCSSSHFARAFSKQFNLSPRAFKKRCEQPFPLKGRAG